MIPPQNVCTNHRDAGNTPVPEPPECGGTSAAAWEPVWSLSGTVCWCYSFGWDTEKTGEHWAGGENVVAGANAVGERSFNPYYSGEGFAAGQSVPGYSPIWHVAIRTLKPFSSSVAPFPAEIAEQMSDEPRPLPDRMGRLLRTS